MKTTFCKLSEKEVINCNDGSRVGCLTDLELSVDDCRVTALLVTKVAGLFTKPEIICIPWEKIETVLVLRLKFIPKESC